MSSGFWNTAVSDFSASPKRVASLKGLASLKNAQGASVKPAFSAVKPTFNSPAFSQVLAVEDAPNLPTTAKTPPPEADNSANPPTSFTPEEAKLLNVLVQTDALLDNPKFEPAHASLIGLKEGAKIGALIGLPLSFAMMLLRAKQKQMEMKELTHPWLRKIPPSLFKPFGFTSIEQLANDGEAMKLLNLKRLAKVLYGTGLSAVIGGLFFGPAVAFLIVSNARSQLQNIKRSIKEDYKDYQPDFIDKHFSHIDKVEDPQSEYNKVRQELTNKRDAAANGFHTAVFVKFLTLGSKLVVAGILGGLFEVVRHSWGYWDKVKDRPKNEGVDYKTEEGSKKLELNNYAHVKKDLLYGWHTQGHEPNVELGLFYKQNELSRQEMDELEKSANTLIDALEKTSVKNWADYVGVRLKHSPVTHLLKETGIHLINPLMLGNFLITPAVVALSMIPFFVNKVGVEPYHANNPEGSRWKKLLSGIRLSQRKEASPTVPRG
jgi:hypothetical protein